MLHADNVEIKRHTLWTVTYTHMAISWRTDSELGQNWPHSRTNPATTSKSIHSEVDSEVIKTVWFRSNPWLEMIQFYLVHSGSEFASCSFFCIAFQINWESIVFGWSFSSFAWILDHVLAHFSNMVVCIYTVLTKQYSWRTV